MSSIPQLERLFRPLVMDLLTCGAGEKEIKRAMADAKIRRRACELLIGKRVQQTDRSEVFYLEIDRALPLSALMTHAGFEKWADTFHDVPPDVPSGVSYALVKLGRLLTPDVAVVLIKAMGYVPAGLRELLSFIERPPPFYQLSERVTAFGTTWVGKQKKYQRVYVPSFHANLRPSPWINAYIGTERHWLELHNKSGKRSNCLVRVA